MLDLMETVSYYYFFHSFMKLSGDSFRETNNRLVNKRFCVLLISYFRDEIMVLIALAPHHTGPPHGKTNNLHR